MNISMMLGVVKLFRFTLILCGFSIRFMLYISLNHTLLNGRRQMFDRVSVA